jgi:hypothetical protein
MECCFSAYFDFDLNEFPEHQMEHQTFIYSESSIIGNGAEVLKWYFYVLFDAWLRILLPSAMPYV